MEPLPIPNIAAGEATIHILADGAKGIRNYNNNLILNGL